MVSSRLLRGLKSLFFPSICPVCSELMNEGELALCTRCRYDMPLTFCDRTPYNNLVTQIFDGLVPVESAVSLFFYNKNSGYKHLVHNIKYYNSKRSLAIELGQMLGRNLVDSGIMCDVDMLLPIPIHPIRLLNRGFNQSEQLAIGISKVVDIPISCRSVVRCRNNKSQVGRKSGERLLNVQGLFKVVKPELFVGKHILIIDDVLTTGATIESCARAILDQVDDVRISVATLAVSDYRINS